MRYKCFILRGIIFFVVLIFSCSEEDKKYNYEFFQSDPLFTLVSPEKSGFKFTNHVKESNKLNYFTYNYLYNGGGVAIGDINNDGLPDIFMTSTLTDNHLFLNKGKMKFEDITLKAGVGGKETGGISTGVTMADVNNDGHLDIYLCKSGPFEKISETTNLLYINNGDLTFSEKAAQYGLNDIGFSTMASFFDYNKDGWIDMYLLSHKINFKYTFEDLVQKRNQYDPEASDKLFRNNGNGTFTNVSAEAGLLGDFYGYGLGVSTADMTGDGWPDIYVSNDFSGEDYYYVNNQKGGFKNQLLTSMQHSSNFGMGCDVADINNDGYADLFQADMNAKDHYRQKTNMGTMSPYQFWNLVNNGFHYQYMRNSLQLNNRNGYFSEIAQMAGVSATDWSWSGIIADFENDGWKDLFVTNGLKRDMRNSDSRNSTNPKYVEGFYDDTILQALGKVPSVKLSNPIFRNNGDLTFTDKTKSWGLDITMNSNGAAAADLDRDGDLDLIVNNVDVPSSIFQNMSREKSGNHYLRVRFSGDIKNPFGLGNRVTIKKGNNIQYQELQNARGFQSSSEYVLHFGLGSWQILDEIIVEWNDGKTQLLKNIKANQELNISYQDAQDLKLSSPKYSMPYFKQIIPTGIQFKHNENSFNDFAREILLPYKLSNNGPYVSVVDVNKDGYEDFFVGGAAGQSGELYLQQTSGNFSLSPSQPWKLDQNSEDMGSLFFDSDQDGDPDLYVCSGGNDFKEGAKEFQDRLYLNDGNGIFVKDPSSLPVLLTSKSCVAAGDYDKDGDMDLFIGGRLIPGKYPYPPKSYLLRNDKGNFKDVTNELLPGQQFLGMVTSALWSDFDKDGFLDLVITGEWMPITILKNNKVKFINVTETLGLENSRGIWFSLAEVDFDKDGDLDYFAGNLGLNSKFQISQHEAFGVYSADFDKNGTVDIVLTTSEEGKLFPVRGRSCSSEQMPFIKDKFKTYDQFAWADMHSIFGSENLKSALHYEANTLQTSFIENKSNGRFELKPLPSLAQISPTMALHPGDFNGDGFLDILVSGNFYPTEVETTRYDAGTGMVFLSDGKNNFQALPWEQSGFFANRDSRGLAPISIGKDKKPGFILANNNDSLQVFIMN